MATSLNQIRERTIVATEGAGCGLKKSPVLFTSGVDPSAILDGAFNCVLAESDRTSGDGPGNTRRREKVDIIIATPIASERQDDAFTVAVTREECVEVALQTTPTNVCPVGDATLVWLRSRRRIVGRWLFSTVTFNLDWTRAVQ